jgi:biopolymer transport protein ExbD
MKFAVRKRRAPTIIIVSLVDILTILLIFFVVSTTFKKDQPQLDIKLPESKTSVAKPAELEHAIVSVDANDELNSMASKSQWRICRKRSPTCARAQEHPRPESRREGLLGIIVKVMDALKLAGVKSLPASLNPGEMKLPIFRYGHPVCAQKGSGSRGLMIGFANWRRTCSRRCMKRMASDSPRSKSARCCS